MTDEAGSTIGERVAYHRRRLGLSQAELAARMERSMAWVSNVERGVQPVNRRSVVVWLAQNLDVPIEELLGEPHETQTDGAPNNSTPVPSVDQIRAVLTGHPALGTVLGDTEGATLTLPQAKDWTDKAWELTHAARYAELAGVLSDLLPRLERSARLAPGDQRPGYGAHLVRAYMAASAALAKLDETDVAWVASERAATAAEATGDKGLLLATQHRLALALLGSKRLDIARQVATAAVDAAQPLATKEPTGELAAVFGALHLVLAVIAAREGEGIEARQFLDTAAAVAANVGPGRNDLTTEFGPANVTAHRVSVAVEMGNAGEALEVYAMADLTQLSPERQARTLIDVARAYDQLHRPADARLKLLEAESLAPEQVRDHVLVRDLVRSLMAQAKRARPELLELAERVGVRGQM